MNNLLQRRKGAAVPLAMIAIMILLAMGVGLLSLGRTARVYAVRTSTAIAARTAADSGLTMALFEMNDQLQVKPWNDSTLPVATNEALPSCANFFSYTVTNNGSGSYTVTSTGTSGLSQRQVSCNLELKGPFEYAIFGREGAELRNSATIDWYNYDADDPPLKIGTNSIEEDAIILKNSATVNGDVVVGVGGDPDVVIDNLGTITGDSLVSTEEHDMPAITVPEWLDLLPAGGTIKNDTVITTSAKYSEIDLKNSKMLQIDGDVTLYITGDVTLGNSAEIQVLEDASLVLYMSGDLEAKNSSKINNLAKDAKKLQLYALDSCENMEFKNSSDFFGSIYAPNADVTIHNSVTVYGAVAANRIDLRNSGTLYYDASLRDVTVDDEAVRFVITNWHEE